MASWVSTSLALFFKLQSWHFQLAELSRGFSDTICKSGKRIVTSGCSIKGNRSNLANFALSTVVGARKRAQLRWVHASGTCAIEALGLPEMQPALDGAPQGLRVGYAENLAFGNFPLGEKDDVHVVVEAMPHIGRTVVGYHGRTRIQGSHFSVFVGLPQLESVGVQNCSKS